MTETTADRPPSRLDLVSVARRFKPVCDHLLAAHREVLLAARSALDTQIEILEDWRAKHTRPEPLRPRGAD